MASLRRYISIKVLLISISLFVLFSCEDEIPVPGYNSSVRRHPERRNVMIVYAAGFNSLSNDIYKNIEDLKKGYLPSNHRDDNVLLVFSKLADASKDYRKQSTPVLIRLYKNKRGKVVSDTLIKMSKGTVAASEKTLNEVLLYIKDKFPAAGYGLIVSSHATGWLPEYYYNFPYKYNSITPQSITQEERVGSNGERKSYEIELKAFIKAIPMHLQYIIFDACLMGGIEVAYELKDICNMVAFSQAEILAAGMNYTKMAKNLIATGTPDLKAVCTDYFEQYNTLSGAYRSATISLAKCSETEDIAILCRELFNKYRVGLNNINPNMVQGFYTHNRHWFYDLIDIVRKAGASDEELNGLQRAIDKAILYKGSTPSFLNLFKINTFSGFSMYLPANGSKYLDNYYKTLNWNNATSLVE